MSIGLARCAVERRRIVTCACLEYRVHAQVVSRRLWSAALQCINLFPVTLLCSGPA